MEENQKHYTFYNTLNNQEIDTITLSAGLTINEELESRRRTLSEEKGISLDNIGFTELLEKNLEDFNAGSA